MIINTRTRSEIIMVNKDILVSKNKNNILEKITNQCKFFLSKSEDTVDFSHRKKALHAWITGVQNAINGGGTAEIDFTDKKGYIKELSTFSAFPKSLQGDLEKLAVHRNAPFGNRKLNLFGSANFTTHIEKLIENIDNISNSKEEKSFGISLDDTMDETDISSDNNMPSNGNIGDLRYQIFVYPVTR